LSYKGLNAPSKVERRIDFSAIPLVFIQPRVLLWSLFVSRRMTRVITRAVSPLYNELSEIYARFVSRLAYNRPANYFQLPWPRAYQLI